MKIRLKNRCCLFPGQIALAEATTVCLDSQPELFVKDPNGRVQAPSSKTIFELPGLLFKTSLLLNPTSIETEEPSNTMTKVCFYWPKTNFLQRFHEAILMRSFSQEAAARQATH